MGIQTQVADKVDIKDVKVKDLDDREMMPMAEVPVYMKRTYNLKVSYTTVQSWAKTGYDSTKNPGTKVYLQVTSMVGRRMVKKADLEAFLSS